MENLEQSDDFRRAFQFANETNRCVFLTGKAGTGKTTLLKYIRENCIKQIAVVAPTGVAAINAGGVTIHSFFQLPFTPFLPPDNKNFTSAESRQLLGTIKLNNTRRSVIRQLDLLIIDEVSMVRCDVLDALDVVLRSVRRRNDLPFGGVQVMMVGDMYQLPPVVKDEEWNLLKGKYKSPYFFDSHIMEEVSPVYIELEKIFRQDEPEFISLLNRVRNNEMDDAAVALLNSRYDQHYTGNDAIVLTTHNHLADSTNASELDKLPGKQKSYDAEVSGTFPEKSFPAEQQLKLKVGARVMFIRNDTMKRYFNGKTGIVAELSSDTVTIRFEDHDSKVILAPEVWENMTYSINKESGQVNSDIVGTFMQFPLRLAWAITIHKSQGLTFDKVIIDAGKAFSAGQVYVALSRCRSLGGIVLSSRIDRGSLMNDEKVVNFAGAKKDAVHLGHALTEGKQNYIRNILLDLFHMNEIIREFTALHRTLEENSGNLLSYDNTWISNILLITSELQRVSSKFTTELNALWDQQADTATTSDRLNKASEYFTTKLGLLMKDIKDCPIASENRSVSDRLEEQLHECLSLVRHKEHMMLCCKGTFDLQGYIRIRQQFKAPEFKFRIYSADSKKTTYSDVPHPELYAALLELRNTICQEDDKPIYMVANREALMEMCRYLPSDKAALGNIKGFGKIKVESIGPRFLEIIKDYMEEHDLQSTLIPTTAKKTKDPSKQKSAARSKGATNLESLRLFRSGKSVEEISVSRNLAPGTIQAHLVKFIESGELTVQEIVDTKTIDHIKVVYESHPEFNTLTQFKEKCDPEISYSDIRSVLASLPKREIKS